MPQNSLLKFHGSASRLYEYVLVSTTDSETCEHVIAERNAFSSNYNTSARFQGKPNILLSHFLAKDEMEDTLVRWMQRIIGEQRSFNALFDRYLGVPAHTILLPARDPSVFEMLYAQLEPINYYVVSNSCPPVKFIRQPYLPLASHLSAAVYQQAVRDYATKPFIGCCPVHELVLLRREAYGDECKPIAKFNLLPSKQSIHS